MRLLDPTWDVVLDGSRESHEQARAHLKNTGGYAFTQTGFLRRVDGNPFPFQQARLVLDALTYLLTFAHGGGVTLMLPVGMDEGGRKVWEQWTSARSPRWTRPAGWYPTMNAEALEELFPAFVRRWHEPQRREAFERVLRWWVLANSGRSGPDGSLILAHAGLELLAWTYLKEERGLLSRNAFDDLDAADQIRRLLRELEIPTEVPALEATGDLAAVAREKEWDGPESTTKIRNTQVHPPLGRQLKNRPLTVGAWQLAMWYLELSVLAILGYRGRYSPRLRATYPSETESMPYLAAEDDR